MRLVLKTIRVIVFLSNAPDAALANPQAQLIQILALAWPAVAAKAQTMLIADMRQEHHVAPLPMRWGPVLPGI